MQVILVSITYCGYIVVAVVSIAGSVIVEQESMFKRTFALAKENILFVSLVC